MDRQITLEDLKTMWEHKGETYLDIFMKSLPRTLDIWWDKYTLVRWYNEWVWTLYYYSEERTLEKWLSNIFLNMFTKEKEKEITIVRKFEVYSYQWFHMAWLYLVELLWNNWHQKELVELINPEVLFNILKDIEDEWNNNNNG